MCDRFNARLCDICAKRGQLESLKWARSKGCPWTKPRRWSKEGTCCVAAIAGHLHILQWSRENGCDWDADTCSEAARAGHWDLLVWAIRNGVPMERLDFNLCDYAASFNRWDMVQLALNHGCSCSEDIHLRLLHHTGKACTTD